MVAILLATYNSEKYLEIQLNSIFAQTYKEWILYVRDDGSTDNTIEILKKYSSSSGKIVLIEDKVKHKGAKNSFLYLLENVQADYYMFCDHDDYWLPNKIEISLQSVGEKEKKFPNKPICLYTDAIVVDSNYKILAKSLWKSSKIKPWLSERMPFLLMFNPATGCTMMINDCAKNCLLPVSESVPMHDVWIAYSVLTSSGILFHIKNSTLLYCQHGNNVVGANMVSANYVANKIRQFKKVVAENKKVFHWINESYKIGSTKYLLYKLFYSIIRVL